MQELTNAASERLRSGDVALGVGVRITSSVAIARIMAAAGFDWLFIDLEHGSLSIESCAQVSTAALDAGIAPLVRVPPQQHWLATRALEGGALGIVMPNVQSAEEARALVDVVKFRPVGRRNVGGPPIHTAYTPTKPDELARMFNAVTIAVAMVETPEAIDRVDEIASVDGIDVVMIGGNDLSTTMGIGGQTGDARMIGAFEQLTAACRQHGKWAGMGGVANNEHLQKFIAMGVRFVLAGADTGFLAAAASQRAKAIRDMDAPKD